MKDKNHSKNTDIFRPRKNVELFLRKKVIC